MNYVNIDTLEAMALPNAPNGKEIPGFLCYTLPMAFDSPTTKQDHFLNEYRVMLDDDGNYPFTDDEDDMPYLPLTHRFNREKFPNA